MRKSPELPNELCAQLGEAETFASAVKRLWWENKLAAASAIVILLFILAAILAPVLTPYTFDSMDLHNRLAPPSRAHLLGTDEAGRDVLTRMLYGSRVQRRTDGRRDHAHCGRHAGVPVDVPRNGDNVYSR